MDPMESNDYLHLIVEVSVTVYVFLLGLPVLVNQIFLPEDLRRISKRNYTGNTTAYLLLLTGLLLSILAIAFWGTVWPPKIRRGFLVMDVIVTVFFVLMLLITLRFLYQQLIRSQGYRAKIIEVIRQKILGEYRRSGKLDKAYLGDLERLGVYSNRGMETQNVINALENILNHVLESEQDYLENNALLLLIDTLCLSVTNSVEPGSRNNMVQVLTIYKSILMDLASHSTPDNQMIFGNETRKIKDCTTKIAYVSLKLDYADMMPLVLNVLTLIPGSSDKLFDIGLLALRTKQFKIATNVLGEIMDRDNQDKLTVDNYLGLIAHFYAAGPTARNYADRSLQNNGIRLGEGLLQSAINYHFALSNFETVDRLKGLISQ